MLTFPDEISFGICPVKSSTRKMVLIQNVGQSVAKFRMRSRSDDFVCPSEDITVQLGSSYSLDLYYVPSAASNSLGELEVEFSNGTKCYISVNGTGKNVDVTLSTPSVNLEPSYISLLSHKTLRIHNQSDIPIKFSWKSFSTKEAEEDERHRLLTDITYMERIEQSALLERIQSGFYGRSSDDLEEIPFAARADEAALTRKYRNLRRVLENDSMQFVDDIFEIVPSEGQVWAHSELEVTVGFRPDTAALFTCLVYLDVTGRQERLPLSLSGQGIGPAASLSFDVLDVGDIFVNDEQTYTVSIINTGDIPAQWSLMPSLTTFGQNFVFEPKEGVIAAGKSQALTVKFESNVLGEFSEYFRFLLQGNEDMLVCQIKGHVVGPTFHFDCSSINFGTVSYDYIHSTNLRLVNTSKISMVFNLRVPQDGEFLKKEFDVVPSEGTLRPGEHVDVVLEFIPNTVKIYDYSLAVDVFGVGDILLSIPITAECIVSSVRLSSKEIEFKECFLRYPYEEELILYNMSDIVHTKFEFLPQMPYTKSIATYEMEPSSGVIEPGDSMRIKIRLVTLKLGQIKIPIMLTVAGSVESPIQAIVIATAVGPKVVVDATELKWGNIDCLKDFPQVLKITNDSLISASLKLFQKVAKSKYDLSFREVILDAHESKDLTVTANLDDTIVITDEVHIVVEEGEGIMVPLSAKGIGTTIHSTQDLHSIDLGIHLTNAVFERQIMLENRGRRPQYLKFTNKTVNEENYRRVTLMKKLGKDSASQTVPKHLRPVVPYFTITPEEITLRPRTATTFTIKGCCSIVSDISEVFTLESRVGKERNLKIVAEPEMKASIINPLLECSESNLSFIYEWERGVEPKIQKREVTLKNSSALSLTFVLKVDNPFNLNSWEHTLEPGQIAEVVVEFDPSYKDDQQSHIVDKQLMISYRGHSQKDYINLKGEIIFPNLLFETNIVNFGSILNDTTKRYKIKVTNCSKVVTTYEWSFSDERGQLSNIHNRKLSAANSTTPVSQVFDILPVRSVLNPGESEDVEFSLFGLANNKFNGTAVCAVVGGPDYKLSLFGEASTVSYSIDKSIINFGQVLTSETKTEELTILNNGRVTFYYDITPVLESSKFLIDISSASDNVAPGESKKVVFTVSPYMPQNYVVSYIVKVGLFDPVEIQCYCQGIFKSTVVTLPRQLKIGPCGETGAGVGQLWETFMATANENIVNPSVKLLPPPPELQPTPASATTLAPPLYVPPSTQQALPPAPGDNESDKKVCKNSQQLELEMQRLTICKHLSKIIDEQDLVTQAAGSSSLQSVLSKSINIKSVVSAQYLCDFGHVILGSMKKKVFKVTNTSLIGQLSWDFDFKILGSTGFSVEPDKVSKLLENESVEIVAKFSPRANMHKVGRKTVILPISISGLATNEIILTANVCIPDIEISTEVVDFGPVLIGQSKKMYIRLHNPSPVVAKWSLKKVKDDPKITITPSEGSLRGGKKEVLCIEFMPSDERRYVVETIMKIESNKNTKSVNIVGSGFATPLKFEPQVVELGPIIPYSDGDEKVITVHNTSHLPIEFYSLDFDSAYKMEEEILTLVGGMFDSSGLLRSSIRQPGDGLSKEIMDYYQTVSNIETATQSQASDVVTSLLYNPVISSTGSSDTPRDKGLHQDILVVGPPLVGTSSVCKFLSKKLSLVSKAVDEILSEVARTDSDVGQLARRMLNCCVDSELTVISGKRASLQEAADKAKFDVEDAFRKDKKNKGKEPDSELTDALPEVLALKEFDNESAFTSSNLAKIIQYRLSWQDATYGFIFDSFVSTFTSDHSVILKAIEICCPKLILANINVDCDETAYSSRLAKLHDETILEIQRLTKSIDQSSKLNEPKKGKDKRSTKSLDASTTGSAMTSTSSIPFPSYPEGDEPWLTMSGLVMELDAQDFKALENDQKSVYLAQLLFQQHSLLEKSNKVLENLSEIWSATDGLLTVRKISKSSTDETKVADETKVTDEPDNSEPIAQNEDAVDNVVADAGTAIVEPVPVNPFTKLDSVKHVTLLFQEYLDGIKNIIPTFTFYEEPQVQVDAPEDVTSATEPPVQHEQSVEAPSGTEAIVTKPKEFGLFEITLDGEEDEDAECNLALTLLPPPKVPPADKFAIPNEELFQVYKRSYPRIEHRKVKPNFTVSRDDDIVEGEEADTNDRPPFRWVIKENSSIRLKIKYLSTVEGKFDSTLAFEVMGTQQVFMLPCVGVCEMPKINSDSRNIFMKRIKSVSPNDLPPQKKFIINDGTYSFGPILVLKKPEWKLLPSDNPENVTKLALLKTNNDVIRLTNTGKYSCQVDLGFEDDSAEVKNIFTLDPPQVMLEEGESKDVKLWAFPTAVREYKNTLVACVTNNPVPIKYKVSCWGVEPTIDIQGPWDESLKAAEAAVAACTDKKLVKDLEVKVQQLKENLTMEFDRILIGKSAVRSFEVKNTSLLPVSFEIGLGDFENSKNISISPSSGVIQPNVTLTLNVTFTSEEPILLDGKFTFRFSDSEGGLAANNPARIGVRNMRCVAEAYKIQIASLSADGAGETDEIDFGLLRVGDYASQIIKISNKGKYKISYKINVLKSSMSDVLKVEPDEGVIEAGTSLAEVKVIFCMKKGEATFKRSKELQICISEPLTNELVESNPIYLSAAAKYNKYRMQPGKGVSFGAIRFDSEVKSKRVELRNDGQFDFTYLICGSSSEQDELDSIDNSLFGVYAYGTAPALREIELGKSYMDRLGAGAIDPKAKGKDAKPPAKGKGAAPEPTSTNKNNFVYDPDNLPVVSPPEDPLVISAFKVFPRIGVVQPGQSVPIDIKFDPSSCSVAKETLRICITGIDPKDGNNYQLRNFDITGESSVPGINISDFRAIFEEQGVVNSLSELSSNGDSVVGKVAYSTNENTFTFGPVMCGAQGSRGVTERIRIMNPTKIDTKVKFLVVPAGSNAADFIGGPVDSSKDAKGKDAKGKDTKGKEVAAPVADTNPVFTVQPETWDIPPHESRFINIYFNPTEIKSYKAMFLACVDLETVPKAVSNDKDVGKLLQFDLGGSGTLPCIVIDQPHASQPDGTLPLDFGRVLVNKVVKRKVVIRNDGILAATCLFQMSSTDNSVGAFSFPYSNASLAIDSHTSKEIIMVFQPKDRNLDSTGVCEAKVKITVLNNQYDNYTLSLKGSTYKCDANLTIVKDTSTEEALSAISLQREALGQDESADENDSELLKFSEINLSAAGENSDSVPPVATRSLMLTSISDKPLKFKFKHANDEERDMVNISPSCGHLGPKGKREIKLTISTTQPIDLKSSVSCIMNRIEYEEGNELCGLWDDSMKVTREASSDDLNEIKAYETSLIAYNTQVEAEKKKGAKGKPVGPPPEPCRLQLLPVGDDGVQYVNIVAVEPPHNVVPDFAEQTLAMNYCALADSVKYRCEGNGENIPFSSTFLFQSSQHIFTFHNDSKIKLPVKWSFDDISRKGTTRGQTRQGTARIGTAGTRANESSIPNPFSIDPEECEVPPMSSKQFNLKFLPLDCENFVYLLKGETLPSAVTSVANGIIEAAPSDSSAIRMVIRGSAKRPICHFDMVESLQYLSTRPLNLKNENGIMSPIECGDIRVVNMESIGLRTRNTYRFQIINPTSENFEFLFEAVGDPSPAWRCVHQSGMLFAGKRIEIIFEYLPEDVNIAESFFRFRVPSAGLSQLFLFAGKVIEPKVSFSSSRVDFHSVMLGGEGGVNTIYIENQEHLPFNFAFDRSSLPSSDDHGKPILAISPLNGSVPPYGKTPVVITFQPSEETIYNYNISCDIKRKPNKLSLNIKGEGYAVHPCVQLENTESSNVSDRLVTLKPAPSINYVDFGSVQVYDNLSKNITVTNTGKYNFDYVWETEKMNNAILSLSGGKIRGTLHKGEEMSYKVTFAPQSEINLGDSIISFNVAGKYMYNLVPKGSGVKPALQFSFMQFDFGPCFITSPGGQTIVEEATLSLVNRDSVNNISIDCGFQKTRALWIDCPPTVLEPGAVLNIPIRFAPRDVKDYTFILPFIVNGTSKIPVTITGSGIQARIELADPSQRRINFGIVNVGDEVRKNVTLINRSKKALAIQLVENDVYSGNAFEERCVLFHPKNEVVIPPKKSLNIALIFSPSKRVSQFSDDLLVRYAGVTTKLINISGKAQGIDVALDTDSLPFGNVVQGSMITKTVALENNGDISISFNWLESTLGNSFTIKPMSGKVSPLSQITFEVSFHPAVQEPDIRQNMLLAIPGVSPLSLSCSGSCVTQPDGSVQTLNFNSLVRKLESKVIKITNPVDKECYISPSLSGNNWKVPPELKLPAKGTADLTVSYFPVTMSSAESSHQGKLFIALPDGTAQAYQLIGVAGKPECSGDIVIETPAKKVGSSNIKLNNWLGESQRFKVEVELTEKPTPATFVIIANVIDIAPYATKEVPIRFNSFVEGNTKGKITFTNTNTGEYCFYNLIGKSIMAEVIETIKIEAPVRQSARYIVGIENPLAISRPDIAIEMGSSSKPDEWWTCDSKFVRLKELTSFTPGSTEATFEIEYRPLLPTKAPTEHLVTIITKNLGIFKYKVVLTAVQSSSLPSLKFNVPLGSTQTETFVFKAYNTAKCDYACMLKRSDVFSVPKAVTVDAITDWNGSDIKLAITYEPMEVGEVRDVITLTHPDGGEYVCELVATCIAPTPQGPFYVSRGKSVDIPFRNIFASATSFTYSIDSPAFKINSPSATVPPKSQGTCAVTFDPQGDLLHTPGGVIGAKLFIKCSTKPDLSWIMYLSGAIGDPSVPVEAAGGGKKK